MSCLISFVLAQATCEERMESEKKKMRLWVRNWLLNVMCNDISVIYVTAHRCAGGLKNKFDLRLGSQRHRHFVWFFNVPVQPPTRGHPFYGYSEKPSHLVAFYDNWGYGGPILTITPRGPQMEALTMNLKVVSLSPNVGKNFSFCILSTWGPRDFKMRMGHSVS